MGEAEGKPKEYVHPLVRKEIGSISDWSHWLRRWEETSDAEILLGLLHTGFSVRTSYPDEVVARICFYLEIADGHRCESVFRPEDKSGWWDRELSGRRLLLAVKAWKMLCGNFFKESSEQGERGATWKTLTLYPVLFEKLIWFFDPRRHEYPGNIPRRNEKHEGEIVHQFLEEWIALCWGWQCGEWRHDEKCQAIKQIFLSVRLKFIDILEDIGRLNFLLTVPTQARVEVNQASMRHLRRLALGQGYHKQYATIEEAIFDGRQAARVYLLLSTMQAEDERRRKVAGAEELKRKAEKQLEELANSRGGGK